MVDVMIHDIGILEGYRALFLETSFLGQRTVGRNNVPLRRRRGWKMLHMHTRAYLFYGGICIHGYAMH
jgi:hypothetical protein